MIHKDRWIQIVMLLLIAAPFIVISLVVTLPELAQVFLGLMGLGLVFQAILKYGDFIVDRWIEGDKREREEIRRKLSPSFTVYSSYEGYIKG